jgi:hypothetical protein
LSAILHALTRYSANEPQFPVDDRSLFTGAKPDTYLMRLGKATGFTRSDLMSERRRERPATKG